jgi:hypothetical protein
MLRTLTLALISLASPLLAQTGKLSAGEQSAVIKAVREYALSYTKSLPNYTCTLTTREVANPPNAGNKTIEPLLTKIEEQLSFFNGKEIRAVTRIDGRPASADAGDQLKESTKGEFGALLDAIFEPATGAELVWDRSATLTKRKVDVISFRVPQAHGYVLNGTRGSLRAPFVGFIYADSQTHAVMRLQMKCVMIPPDFEMQNFTLTLEYKAVQVAGHETILPSHFVLNYRDFADDRQHNDDGQYSGYREFSADATLEFEDPKQ